MITYRLNDALPQSALGKLKNLPKDKLRKQIETQLNSGYGKCLLARPEIAEVIVENWHYFDGKRYRLMAYVVMPNHVHVLVQVYIGVTLSSIVHGWKSYTSKRIIRLLDKEKETYTLPIWQPEYWDRYIRNQRHFDAAVEYIVENPVKAGLVKRAEDWRWLGAQAARLLKKKRAGEPPALP